MINDAELFANWYLWLVIAAVIIIAAAVLLIAVWFAAKRILTLAVAALGLVKQIRSNTQCVWKLADTNQTAGDILNTAQSIHGHGGQVAGALHAASKQEA